MNYYAALDVSLRSVHLCVMDENGQIHAEGQVDSEPQDVDAFLRKLTLEITTIGLEAGTLTQYLTYGLRAAGYSVVCMETRQVKVALSAMRNKTDKNDARGMARSITWCAKPLRWLSTPSDQCVQCLKAVHQSLNPFILKKNH